MSKNSGRQTTRQEPPFWLAVFLYLPVVGGIFLGGWYLLILSLPRTAAGLLIFAIFLAILWIISRWAGRWPKMEKTSAILLWFMAFIPGLTLVYPTILISPIWSLLLLALLPVTYYLEYSGRSRLPLSPLLLLVAFAGGCGAWHPVLLALPLLALLLLLGWLFRRTWYPTGPGWLFWLLVLAVSPIIVPFSWGIPRSNEAEQITGQAQVKLIYDAANRQDPLSATLGREIRFGYPDCLGRLLVGTRSAPYGLVRLDPQNPVTAPIGPIGDFIGLDCSRRRIYAGEWKAGKGPLIVHAFDQENLNSMEDFVIDELQRTTQLRYLPVLDRLFVSADNAKHLFINNFETGSEESFDTKKFIIDFAVLPPYDLLVIACWGGSLYYYRLSTLQLEKEDRIGDFALQLFPSSDFNSLWISALYTGRLVELSPADRKIVRRIWMRPGVRFCLTDPDQEKLYIGNYFTGDVSIVDRRSMREIRRYFAGRHLRNLSLFPRPKRLVAATASGLVEIKLEPAP